MTEHSSLFAGVWYGGKRASEGQNKVLYPGELPIIIQKGCFSGMVSRLVLILSTFWFSLASFTGWFVNKPVNKARCYCSQQSISELIDTEFSFINNVRGWMV